ncbi:tetratricopeptide repeat protein [Chryseobacterium gwangjuense]|uniref:tetratricopeptide repeat protein n=1 Tax=Chryseobacterium gwangjuense TaxID=1069980 RepID=UPI001E5A27C7|nr:LuxR C-terminal-related transcriptional regulator [Chryseobacterium gwangjuense]MCE3074508.1 LuxR C-terminal-related transcriptional regulator [Chryseobacterium gwangjuense]
MKVRLFFVFLLCFSVIFCFGQEKKSYEQYLDKANELKFKDWGKTELNIQEAQKKVPEENLGDFYIEVAKIYSDVNYFDLALEYASKANHLFLDKDPEKTAKVNGVFAYIYSQLNDTQRAITYYKKLLNFYQGQKKEAETVKSLNNLGNAYLVLSKMDSSKYYFEKGLKAFDNYDNPVLKAFVFSNFGKFNFIDGNAPKAETYLLEAKEILEKNNIEDKKSNYQVNYNLANFYIETKDPVKALLYAKNVGNYLASNSINFDNTNYLRTLYKAYQLNKDYKLSSETFKKYDSIRELLNVEEKAVNVERLKVKHEYELQQRLNKIEQDRKNTLYIVMFIILLLVVAICILFLFNFRNKAEKLRLEKKLIENRERELEIDNQMKEKLLVYKSMEQSKIEEIFKSILEQINVLKSKVNDSEIDEVSRIVNEIKINTKQDSWGDFEYHFLNVHESFYENLDAKHPGLTNYDKRLAAMLKLKLSTKEISNLLNVTPKTIENSRTRLRKKMNLTNTKEDLSQYLNEL